jgi:hypothetical protein
MLKRIKFQTSIDGRGNYSVQTAEQLKEALAAHFGGCLVEITITGVPKQPENWRRMYYKCQILPAFVHGLRSLGNDVDPHNVEHLESANDYLSRTILGEHEEENAIGQKLKIANDQEKLSDRDYAIFVEKCQAEIFKLFGVQIQELKKEAEKWEQYQRTPMAVHNGEHPIRVDGESWYNRKPGPTPGASE